MLLRLFNEWIKLNSLCNLCVLCASVVDEFRAKHTTETQRTQRLHREEGVQVDHKLSVDMAQETQPERHRQPYRDVGEHLPRISSTLKHRNLNG